VTEPNCCDLLAETVAAWDAYNDDGAISWERRMAEAIESARSHLRPVLVDVDAAPAPRVCP
jgi:hypothetical protein